MTPASLRAVVRTAAPLLLAAAVAPAHAAWPTQPAGGGVPLSTVTGSQYALASAEDGSGGAYFAWEDHRNGFALPRVYVQHVDGGGNPLWGTNGAPIGSTPGNQNAPRLAADGTGGVSVVWRDFRADTAGDLYAQHFTAAGVPQWGADGQPVCALPTRHVRNLVAAGDGRGGIVAAWQDDRGPSGEAIYAARVERSGAMPWTADGIRVSASASGAYSPAIAEAGSWGVLIGWTTAPAGSWQAYAQRVDSAGVGAWALDGVPLCTDTGGQAALAMAATGDGGAYCAWMDNRSRNGWQQVYAQRVGADGGVLWPPDGIGASGSATPFYNPRVVVDGAGGAYVAWSGYNFGIHTVLAQRFAPNGAPQWTANGEVIALASEGASAFDLQLMGDGVGGLLLAWDGQPVSDYLVYAARVSPSRTKLWTATLCSAPGWRIPQSIVGDGNGGAIVGWVDRRGGLDWDVYAGQVSGSGSVGAAPVASVPGAAPVTELLAPPWPSPARSGGMVTFALDAPRGGTVQVVLCDAAGRHVRTLVASAGGAGPLILRWDGRDENGRDAAPGLYLVRATAGGESASAKLVLTP